MHRLLDNDKINFGLFIIFQIYPKQSQIGKIILNKTVAFLYCLPSGVPKYFFPGQIFEISHKLIYFFGTGT